jgi:exonuclease SbcD
MNIDKYLNPVEEVHSGSLEELRILYFTDPHLHHTSPTSRKDDYSEAILNKISNLAAISKAYKVDLVLIGGDIFHAKAQTDHFISKAIVCFREFTCPVFSVLGNHDIYYCRSDTVHRTPGGIVFSSQVVKHLGSLTYTNIGGKTLYIKGMDFTLNPKVPSISSDYDYSFLVSHQLMPGVLEEFAADECFQEIDLTNSKFSYILNGHDHSTYPVVDKYGRIIVCPGSISRGTRSVSNRFRNVEFGLFSITKYGIHYVQEILPVVSSSEIFSAEDTKMNDLSKRITDFVRSMKNPESQKTSNINVDAIIKNYCKEDEELFRFVKNYFVDAGIV